MLVGGLGGGIVPRGAYGGPDVPELADLNRVALGAGVQECSVGA
jgi:hypothetical protein